MSHHVLMVDDDHEILDLVAAFLGKHGLNVTTVSDGKQMFRALGERQYDLIILDLMLPGEDGMTLSRRLRENTETPIPIVILSARNEDLDRIIGLELGADDYLTKPFAPRELLARIRAVLRRTSGTSGAGRSAATARYLAFGDWRLDRIERCLVNASGTVTRLAGAEYSLLAYFVEQPGRVISRDQLMNRLMGSERVYIDRSIDLRISRLRRLLGDDATDAVYIRTVRNEGYVFAKGVTALS